MKKALQFLLGVNAASMVRGGRLGADQVFRSSFAALAAVHPLQDRAEHRCRRELSRIPEIRLEEILGRRKVDVKLRVQAYEDGMMSSQEAMVLLSILAAEQPPEALEIGTFMGHTTRALAENLPGGIVHTVDLPPNFIPQQDPGSGPPKDDFHLIQQRVVGREFKGQAVESRIRQHFGDTARMDFQELGRPTFFFIDGSHTYEYCKLDSEKCFALCGGAGTFLWHDVDHTHPGVVQFILEWRRLGRDLRRIEGTSLGYWKSA